MSEIPFKVNSLAISNINIINKSGDPRIIGDNSPVNSTYFGNDGKIYVKFGNNNTDWELLFPKETKNITANYNILRTDSNFTIDSTNNNINLILPLTNSIYKGKEFYFKKTVSINNVFISPNTGDTVNSGIDNFITLTTLNDSITLIYVDNNNWTIKTSAGSSNNELITTDIKVNDYSANINDLVLINTSSNQITITLPSNPAIGARIGIKDVGGFVSDQTKNLIINPDIQTIDYSSDPLIINDNFTYIELLYTTINWIIISKITPNKNEFDQSLFKIFKDSPSSFIKFESYTGQQLNIKSPNITSGNYKLGNIPLFSPTEQYYEEDWVEYENEIYKCSTPFIGSWNHNYFNLISTKERIEKIFTQNSHGFIVGDLIKFSTTWQKAQANTLTSYTIGVVSKVIDVNKFKVCFSGYMNGFSGLVANTLYYLSETISGGYTNVKGEILKQPVFFAISTNEAIILQWNPSIDDLLNNSEYVISNNGVLDYTTKSGLFKLVEKNNTINEIDIIYSITNTNVDLVIKNMSKMFSNIKDSSNKINIYVESATVKIQNLSGFMKTFIIKKIV